MKSQYKRAALFALFLILAVTGPLSALAASLPDGPATARAGYHHANSRLRLFPSRIFRPSQRAHALGAQQARVGRRVRFAQHGMRELLGQLASAFARKNFGTRE